MNKIDLFVFYIITMVLTGLVVAYIFYIKGQAKRSVERVSAALEDLDMISSNFGEKKGLVLEGSLSEVSAECILIMREIYKKNKETFNKQIATGILTNMLIKAIDENVKHDDVEWKTSEEEMLSYTE